LHERRFLMAPQPTMLAFLLSRTGYFIIGVAVGVVVRGVMDRWFRGVA
jgi:hypothetical protein